MDFTPQVLEVIDAEHVYISVAMRVKVCAVCQRPMIPAADRMPLYSTGEMYMTVLEQAKRAGWPEVTLYAHSVDGRHICDDCAVEGHAMFRCALCERERGRSEVKARFGTNAEYLCKCCYETVPAARWEAKAEELAQKHRFDF
ncbi:hypothetical protein LVJ94_05550 [Pendulispora rubella]|uniref:Stc1 domain-containing protein n=1 Tax=Pendulispora rubella TaxID=2741070 RepID=A0ABZ2L6Y8_9BACT